MPERGRESHVDPSKLADYLEGKLPEDEARLVKGHLDRCAFCRIEMKKLERFNRIDSDDDLAREAEWLYARTKLEARLRDKTIPSVVKKGPKVIRMPRSTMRWVVPVAAAAVLVVLAAYFGVREKSGAPGPTLGPMRGAPVEYGIALKEPTGEVSSFPAIFKWQSQREDDYFVLEIFNADLKTLYHTGRVSGVSWTAPDSVRAMLKPDSIYLWSVKGYRGLERVLASPNGWFEVKQPAPPAGR